VNEAVDRLIDERGRLDAGLSPSFFVSLTAHIALIGLAVAAPLFMPRQPLLQVTDGFAVVLPRGGGGPRRPPAATKPEPKPAEPAPTVAPPPKVIKPPREQPRPNALPEPDSRVRARPKPTAPRRTEAAEGATMPVLSFGPAGPGVPDGTDSGGDWYLAGVQQKIWMLWNQQIKSGFNRPIGVTFTILADGRVSDVRVTEPSGVTLLDMAAQRAILNAAPFGRLPREYGDNPRTIHAIFPPTG
jgi:TonB family protein